MTEQMAIEETIKEAEESAEANRLEALEYRKHGDINARHIEELSMKLAEQYGNVVMWLKELIQYRAIGTVEELQALKEKSVAKKPRLVGNAMICPSCPKVYSSDSVTYCTNCGQLIDWE